jgi:hypothetical protein
MVLSIVVLVLLVPVHALAKTHIAILYLDDEGNRACSLCPLMPLARCCMLQALSGPHIVAIVMRLESMFLYLQFLSIIDRQ